MLKNKNVLKVLFTILLIVLPYSLNSSMSSEISTPALNTENLSFYQKNTCEISFLALLAIIFYWKTLKLGLTHMGR